MILSAKFLFFYKENFILGGQTLITTPFWVPGAARSVLQSSEFLFFYEDFNVLELLTFTIKPFWVAGATRSVCVCA